MAYDIHVRPEDAEGKTEQNRVVPDKIKHWRSERGGDGVETLYLDRAKSANTLGREVLEELEPILERLEKDPPQGLVLTSGKDDHFVYGGDVNEFQGLDDTGEVRALLERVHGILDRFEALAFPTVAMIRGACLGGGLELALACRHRVARDDAKIGFPEVNLGIHPGFGGTARSTRLLPAPSAMQAMLTGKIHDARKAKKLGLVDDVQPERHLEAAARRAIAKGFAPAHKDWKIRLSNAAPARMLAAEVIERKTREKARRDHYPAPFALIDLWRQHGGDKADMLSGERESVARLITGETAQNLIRAFFLRERLKKAGKDSDRSIRHVHVVGAGVMGGDIAAWCALVMGGDIAAWCALRGFRVSLSDIDVEQIGAAVGRADELFRKKLREPSKVRDAHDRLHPDPSGMAARRADLVIEAVAEKLDVKKKVFAGIVEQVGEDTLLATNTSAIPLEDIAEAIGQPERLMGLHFFNPVAKLPLVEVVRAEGTSDETAAAGAAFCTAIDKLPLPVKSAPGFLVNRVLTPYMLEAMKLIEEGHAPETVDRAAESFGMPMGPVELADSVGLDIGLEVGERLAEHFSLEAPDALKRLVKEKKLGKKTGEGFYVWKGGKAQKNKKADAEPDEAMIDRLVLQMVNACAGCLREAVVEDADMADAGMIFGTGFAPFRGGPMHYAERRGADDVVAALERLAEAHGERFEPDAYWSKTKKKTKTKTKTKGR